MVPVLLALHRDGAELDAARPMVRAQVVDGRFARLAFARGPVVPVATAFVARLFTDHLDPLALAVHLHTRVGLRTLRGAVANAVASPFLHMSWPGPHRPRDVLPGLPEDGQPSA